uniref:Uncharacterized protein n=1 Tax=Arundo donax TaxID=35708 RepID=A0A0A9DGQ7_ARUDO
MTLHHYIAEQLLHSPTPGLLTPFPFLGCTLVDIHSAHPVSWYNSLAFVCLAANALCLWCQRDHSTTVPACRSFESLLETYIKHMFLSCRIGLQFYHSKVLEVNYL